MARFAGSTGILTFSSVLIFHLSLLQLSTRMLGAREAREKLRWPELFGRSRVWM